MTPRVRLVGACAALGAGLVLVMLGGRLTGEAHQAADRGASRFTGAEAETAVRTACASQAPFVVLDTFAHYKPANIDDRLPDPTENRPGRIRHGDIVAAIVEASHPGAIAYQTNPIFNVRTLAGDFRRLATDIETGKIPKPAAAVSSIVLPVDLRQVNALLQTAKPIGVSDVLPRRGEALRVVTGGYDPQNPYTEIDSQLRRLRKAGVPVFVAAGNTGPDETVNMLALSEGVYAVGALGRDGAPTSYTSMPGLVSVWSPGFVVLTQAPGGLSVSGGRGVELKGADLPDQRSIIAAYAGRRADETVRDLPDDLQYLRALKPSRQRNRYIGMTLEPGVYRTQDLMGAYGYPASLGTYARAMAEGPYMHFPSDTIFTSDADGRLRFDPIGDRSDGQLQVADATSFAAPNVCASELFPSRVASAAEGF